jgi:hypothetical protein
VRSRLFVLVTVALVLIVPSPASAQPIDVIATPADEFQPVASIDHIAWIVETDAGRDLYAKSFEGERFRVNSGRWDAATGGISGTMLAYQRYRIDPSVDSDLKFFDLDSRTHVAAPTGLNTFHWEYGPSLSGDRLLFGRLDLFTGDRQIILYDLTTGESIVLAETTRRSQVLVPRQVNGDFAVWNRFGYRRDVAVACYVYLHDMTTGVSRRISAQDDHCEYAPSVDAAGRVFYALSRFACGDMVSLLLYESSVHEQSVLERLPDGTDLGSTSTVDNGDGTSTVYFDPGRCNRHGTVPNQDIRQVSV